MGLNIGTVDGAFHRQHCALERAVIRAAAALLAVSTDPPLTA
jgi:hypothetical protein